MSYYELKDNDVFVNTIEACPTYKFYIQSGSIYINDHLDISGTYSNNILGVPQGFVSLYEYNVNRPEQNNDSNGNPQRIYPFVTKSGQKQKFKTMTDEEFNTEFGYGGSIISSSYNMSSSITKFYITSSTEPDYKYLRSLKSSFRHYTLYSQAFDFSNFESPTLSNAVTILDVPSIFYGNSLKKGEVILSTYISGTLAAQLTDQKKNGELIQTYGPSTGSVEGVVMYDEGIIVLTGSSFFGELALEPGGAADTLGNPPISLNWGTFGYGLASADDLSYDAGWLSASYDLQFDSVSKLQNMTILAKAPYGELNHSNNPTYLKYTGAEPTYSTSSYEFVETNREIKNVVPANQNDGNEPPFQKETYISKICIYDKQKRLVGICKLATPIRKTEANEYLFKLKMDL